MNKIKTNGTSYSISIIFLLIAMLIGGYIRLVKVLPSPFPIGDGGMFYNMTLDLINNKFHLPEFITYNHVDVPNTYPPLGIYLTGAISALFHFNLIDVFRILPAILSILTIPAFYLLAKEMIKNESQVILAVLIFSLAVPSFDWLIKGGGITRAPAFLFSLLALTFIYRLFIQEKTINLLLASAFSALTFLFHPQIALYTFASAVVFFFFLQRNRTGIKKALITAGLTLLMIAPWLLFMLIKFGLTPFVSAFMTGEFSILSIVRFVFGNTLREVGLTSIGLLGIVGLFWYFHDRDLLFPVWAGISLLIDPRSTPRNLSLVFSICASYALIKLFWNFSHKKDEEWGNKSNPFSVKISGILLAVLFCQWIFSAWYTVEELAGEYSLHSEDLTAIQWIDKNTSPDSEFLVLTGMIPFDDSFSEWFPTLSERISLATVQGKEWDTKKDFSLVMNEYESAQSCFDRSESCIADWEKKFGKKIDYVYIRQEAGSFGAGQNSYSAALAQALLNSGKYEQEFENNLVAILRKK